MYLRFVFFHASQATHSGLREIANGSATWKSKEPWSELIIHVDNNLITPMHRKLSVRCETNIFSLYRGAAEAELSVMDDNFWLSGGKVSPTIDQRGNANRGDPDNSALTGSAGVLLLANGRCLLIKLAMFWLIIAVLVLS